MAALVIQGVPATPIRLLRSSTFQSAVCGVEPWLPGQLAGTCPHAPIDRMTAMLCKFLQVGQSNPAVVRARILTFD